MLNSKFTTLLLVAICALCANQIYSMLMDPQKILGTNSNQMVGELKLETTPVNQADSLADRSGFDEITQRSLFSTTRRPEVEEKEIVEEVIVKKPVKPDLKLVGIALSHENNVALIQSQNQPHLQRLKLNESIEGWELIKINPTSVELGAGSQQITLVIQRRANPSFVQEESNTEEPAENEEIENTPLEPEAPQSSVEEEQTGDEPLETEPVPESLQD